MVGICAGSSGPHLISDTKTWVAQLRAIALHLSMSHVSSLHHCAGQGMMVGRWLPFHAAFQF